MIKIIEHKLNKLCRVLYNIKKIIKNDIYTQEQIIMINNIIFKFLKLTYNITSNYNKYKNNLVICENYCTIFINYLFNNITIINDLTDIIIDNKYNTCIILDCDETLVDGNNEIIYVRPYVNKLFDTLNNNNCYVLI